MQSNAYDVLPYPKRSHPLSHVRKLQSVATFFGMAPRSISNCRVLELGCASGWNLLPQAAELPQSEFVGIELSSNQVDEGQKLVRGLKLPNVSLKHADILDVDASWGEYDYILCHGVYSWVPDKVRAKILSICKKNLAPQGVALVSYNVLPGWHFRGVIREMMLFHIAQFKDPAERIVQARAILDFMVNNCPADSTYGKMLRDELNVIKHRDDEYLYHDHLEDHNKAFYFHQFMNDAEAQGLQYLGDSQISTMLPRNCSANLEKILANAPIITQEQYIDFLRNTSFRTTLLCHANMKLNRCIPRDIMKSFHISLASRLSAAEIKFDPEQPLELEFATGALSTSSPLAIALLQQLALIWPRSANCNELRELIASSLVGNSKLLGKAAAFSNTTVAETLMDLFMAGVIDISVEPPTITNQVSAQPLATPLARLQASQGSLVTNLRHENVQLDPLGRYITAALDAEHDRSMLVSDLESSIAQGTLSIENDTSTFSDPSQLKLDAMVDNALRQLCDSALLMA